MMTTARLFDERLRALDDLHASHLETEAAAMTDPLTGLGNRRAFLLKLEAPVRSEPNASGYALLYMDLNRFKNVNDGLGHHVGDAMLQACARRIESVARSGDFVARLGGDEFAIIAENTNDRAAVDHLAHRLLSELCKPYAMTGTHSVLGASIGIALSSECGSDGGRICSSRPTLQCMHLRPRKKASATSSHRWNAAPRTGMSWKRVYGRR